MFFRALALVSLLGGAGLARAEEGGYGNLDFARMTQSQQDFFWRRLRSLAIEEAVLSYCGDADDFAPKAKEGIRACVTQEALAKADAFFKTERASAEASLRVRKASCRARPRADRGWLGVEIAEAPKGALVTAAVAGSPAASADLKAGDVIASLNGETIAGPKQLSAKIRMLAPGATVSLGLLRDGAPHAASIKLGAMAFDASGRAALDMPELIASSRQDLQYVAGEVAQMCRKCKSSIWAVFCR